MMTSQDTRDALNSLLHETGSCSRDFMLVLATNRPEDFDEAVLDRMVSHVKAQHDCMSKNCFALFWEVVAASFTILFFYRTMRYALLFQTKRAEKVFCDCITISILPHSFVPRRREVG